MDPTNSNTDISSPPPQPDYFHAVEVDVIHCKAGGVLRIPTIENIMVRYVTPGATQYSRTISSLQEAVAYTNRVRHRVNPAGDDDVIQVRANIVRYRKRIYNAMILLPHGVNEWQEKQWDDFVKAVKNDKFDMKEIEAKSWQLAAGGRDHQPSRAGHHTECEVRQESQPYGGSQFEVFVANAEDHRLSSVRQVGMLGGDGQQRDYATFHWSSRSRDVGQAAQQGQLSTFEAESGWR